MIEETLVGAAAFIAGTFITWKYFVIRSYRNVKSALPDHEGKGARMLSESDKAYLYLELGIPWLSVTLVVEKDKVRKIGKGDLIGLSELTEERENAMLVCGKMFNLSTKKEDEVMVRITEVELLGDMITLSGRLC